MRKVVGLIEYRLHGNDAKKDSDEELFRKSVSKFFRADPEGAKRLAEELDNLKEQAKRENVQYKKLVENLFDNLLEGIEVKAEHIEKFKKVLHKNQICKYMVRGKNFIIPDVGDYKKAKMIYENLEL